MFASSHLYMTRKLSRNVGQCPTWWPPCRIQVAPTDQRCKVWLRPLLECRAVALPRRETRWNFTGVPQTPEQISAVSGQKFTILWGHVEEICCLTSFFQLSICALVAKNIAWQSCAKVPRWRFLGPAFPASRVQHISDLHSKFALRGRHPICDGWN